LPKALLKEFDQVILGEIIKILNDFRNEKGYSQKISPNCPTKAHLRQMKLELLRQDLSQTHVEISSSILFWINTILIPTLNELDTNRQWSSLFYKSIQSKIKNIVNIHFEGDRIFPQEPLTFLIDITEVLSSVLEVSSLDPFFWEKLNDLLSSCLDLLNLEESTEYSKAVALNYAIEDFGLQNGFSQ
jgi:hypothetical protein